jgi:hypothetical protein
MMWPREARYVEVFEGLAKGLFALALGVDVGGIEEVDAGVDGGFDELVGSGLIDGAYGSEEAGAAVEGHGAETERGDEEAGVAECLVLHGDVLCAERIGGWDLDGVKRMLDSGVKRQ